MGYLDNREITVDAILTRKGREMMAKGEDVRMTHFALADDEIDYTLWNPDHPQGSNFYGKAIEEMPIVEAVPDERRMMRSKLVTLPRKTVRIPQVKVPKESITLEAGQADVVIPSTTNYKDGNTTYGYTAVLSDADAAVLEVVEPSLSTKKLDTMEDDEGQSVTLVGKSFRVRSKSGIAATKTATVTIYGNETGGSTTMTVNVRPQNLETGLNDTDTSVLP